MSIVVEKEFKDQLLLSKDLPKILFRFSFFLGFKFFYVIDAFF